MSPLEYERHDYLGAFFGSVYCDTCRDPVTGATRIKHIHKGYEGQGGKELTPKEVNIIYDCQKDHPHKHNTRIIFGHEFQVGEKGYSKCEYKQDNRK